MTQTRTFPDRIANIDELEELLSRPTDYVIDALAKVPGDIVILGVAGKMGPTLARMVVRASQEAGTNRRVIGVARFSKSAEQSRLEQHGVETIKTDLLDPQQLEKIPDAPNVIYMAGMKFGATGQEGLTWAMNVFLPGMVCHRFKSSRIAAFSTGNVYGLSSVAAGGSREDSELNPLGDYAMSCVGRERMFDHFSRSLKIPVSLIRLNYAVEMRYGVLVDMAQRVWAGETIDVSMGHFNAIWQGDANAMSIATLAHATNPPLLINVAGPELLGVRGVCEEFGRLMKKPVKFAGKEAPDALISNGQLGHRLFGKPRVSVEQMMRWIAQWVMSGGETLGKPTHFETRDGKY